MDAYATYPIAAPAYAAIATAPTSLLVDPAFLLKVTAIDQYLYDIDGDAIMQDVSVEGARPTGGEEYKGEWDVEMAYEEPETVEVLNGDAYPYEKQPLLAVWWDGTVVWTKEQPPMDHRRERPFEQSKAAFTHPMWQKQAADIPTEATTAEQPTVAPTANPPPSPPPAPPVPGADVAAAPAEVDTAKKDFVLPQAVIAARDAYAQIKAKRAQEQEERERAQLAAQRARARTERRGGGRR